MKKKKIWLLAGIIGLVIVGVFFFVRQINKPSTYQTIAYDSLDKTLASQEKVLLYVRQDGCKYCEQVEPLMKQAARDKNFKTYAVTLNKEKNAQNIKEKMTLVGTPTIIFYVNGVEQERIVGSFDQATLDKKITASFH